MDEPSTSRAQVPRSTAAAGDAVPPSLTHVDARGAARMVDVGDKPVTRRVARAGARVWMAERTLALLEQIALPKGDVLAVAKV
ncbi:MAG: cyclic pyranopterin monophosphate synthase MoaC, partial [Thermoleophilia bacterium]|nr:cyclic pyranopterin monophosphate synthase MoaC [Thermoleophilia bacterium]